MIFFILLIIFFWKGVVEIELSFLKKKKFYFFLNFEFNGQKKEIERVIELKFYLKHTFLKKNTLKF
jgi:hypothetical protein